MELKLVREIKTTTSTIGSLYVDGKKLYDTLEDTDRGIKQSDPLAAIIAIKKQDLTAIPTGRYQVIIDMSNRFQKLMPHVLDVPDFEGIRIHSGNTSADTDGCILLGTRQGNDTVINSRDALAKFIPQLEAGLKQGNVFINII